MAGSPAQARVQGAVRAHQQHREVLLVNLAGSKAKERRLAIGPVPIERAA